MTAGLGAPAPVRAARQGPGRRRRRRSRCSTALTGVALLVVGMLTLIFDVVVGARPRRCSSAAAPRLLAVVLLARCSRRSSERHDSTHPAVLGCRALVRCLPERRSPSASPAGGWRGGSTWPTLTARWTRRGCTNQAVRDYVRHWAEVTGAERIEVVSAADDARLIQEALAAGEIQPPARVATTPAATTRTPRAPRSARSSRRATPPTRASTTTGGPSVGDEAAARASGCAASSPARRCTSSPT